VQVIGKMNNILDFSGNQFFQIEMRLFGVASQTCQERILHKVKKTNFDKQFITKNDNKTGEIK
jgi:hypothetical protein